MKIQSINNIVFEKKSPNDINSNMPRFIRYLNGFRYRMGEKQDIVINAVGTGCVAPIFIKYNKQSEADKNTKTYSALRQVAMAIISVVTQIGIMIPFDRYLNKLIKQSKLGDDYIIDEKILKDKNKNLNPDELKKQLKAILEKNKTNVSTLKRLTNLAVCFAVIPFSSWALNKIYPPFMQKFFPKIANTKAKENK